MTVTTTTVRNKYAANGVTITFPFVQDSGPRAPESCRWSTTTRARKPALPTGRITRSSASARRWAAASTIISGAPASGTTVVLRRELDIVQPADYSNQGRFYPETHGRVSTV